MKDETRKSLEHDLQKKLDDAYAEWEEACSEELITEAANRAGTEDWDSEEFCNAYDEITSEIWSAVVSPEPVIESIKELIEAGLTQEQAEEAHRQAADPNWDGTPDG